MADIVEELKDYINNTDDVSLRLRSADEITALRAKVAGLEAATEALQADRDSVRAQLTEAQAKIEAAGKMEPVLFSVTYNGAHVGNTYPEIDLAEIKKRIMDEQYPGNRREIVPLFTDQPITTAEHTPGLHWSHEPDKAADIVLGTEPTAPRGTEKEE